MTELLLLNKRAGDSTQQLNRPDNRRLGFTTYGHPNGLPVLAFHGIPGTRLMFRPTEEVAARLGLRIIAADRPGFGCSTPQPGRQLRDWLAEVEAIREACQVDRFAVIGISGGAPFATATAAHFGKCVAAMALLGPMGPVAEMAPGELSWLERNIFLRLPWSQVSLRAALTPANMFFVLSPQLAYNMFLQFLPACDREIMSQPWLKAQVIEDVGESLAQGGEGMRADLRIFSQPWNVDYGQITAPTVLWQGANDSIVPIPAALRLGELIPDCTVHLLPEAGHFWIYDHIELVLQTLHDMANNG